MILVSPLKGWTAPLDEVPDPVFAGRMLGDGVAIDPTGDTLHAPCDAEVISIAKTLHAVTLRTAEGVEVLIHLGLDTVALDGEGFTVHVAAGQRVKAGELLIGFDLDLLARRARSVITPVLIANGERFAVAAAVTGREIEIGEPLLELIPTGFAPVSNALGAEHRREVILGLPHGLHARPCGRVAAIMRPFAARVELQLGDKAADTRSPLALMTLGAALGSALVLVGRGEDAPAALNALAGFLTSDGGEVLKGPDASILAPLHPIAVGVARGVRASPGLAIGKAALLVRAEIIVQSEGAGAAIERTALANALQVVRASLSSHGESSIMAAHLALLDDPNLAERSQTLITSGASAGFAWGAALDEQAAALSALDDQRLRERADDLIDLKRRVQLELGGLSSQTSLPPEGSILLADELLPSELMAFGHRISGLVLARGGPTSHVAIIAASLGLPAIVAAGEAILEVQPGAKVILDADAAELRTAPVDEEIAAALIEQTRRVETRSAAIAAAAEPCRMADGTRIEVFANLGRVEEAASALASGAEGCGLLRTEFLFLDRESAPDEIEQREVYQIIASALKGRPLIVRTLDIGGDKPVRYLAGAPEENPALGLRGVRQMLARPDLLDTQLRAILGVRPLGQCRIMAPMISNLSELRAVRHALDAAKTSLGIDRRVELGVMVETPAAALIAGALAEEADFLSIGTNDLTQYTLAMDRGNPATAAGVDALHPAVLRLIGLTCEGGTRAGKWVGVCGGLASEPLAAGLLLGLGVTELSAAPSAIPALKATIRSLDLNACSALAKRALAQPDAAGVRALLRATQ